MSRTFRFLLPLLVAGIVGVDAAYSNVTDGPHGCGGVDIPYPFGIIDEKGNGDFRAAGFGVTCDAGKPVLVFTGDDGDAWQCYDSSGKANSSANGDLQFNNDGVYRISKAKNYFFVLGCATLGFLESKPRPLAGDGNITYFAQLAGCACYCDDSKSAVSGECSGVGCCQANVPPDLVDNFVRFDPAAINVSSSISISSCDYAFLAEKDSYTFNKADLSVDLHRSPRSMPVTLDWAIRDNLTCKQAAEDKAYACRSNNSHCLDSTNGPGYICNCRRGYEGNPYIVDGCTGCCQANVPPDLVDNFVRFDPAAINVSSSISISSCDYAFLAEKDSYTFNKADLSVDLHRSPRSMPVTLDWAIRDNLTCKQAAEDKAYACRSNNSHCLDSTNGPGYICNCRRGYEGNPYIVDGCTGSFGGLLIIAIIVFIFILLNQKRKMRENIQKNGGPMLANFNNIKLYTKYECKKIQKKVNFIGQGSFGTVYKGNLEVDKGLVAVKVPTNIKSPSNDFANEIGIQALLVHKNIVKLVGCCLEVDVPILVCEFVSKGSLKDILHSADKKMPLSMGQRLKIAAQSADGLAYLHSGTSTTILHGDVKPANILLNDEFEPKISDFGISRLIVTDSGHTDKVIGSRGYVDPVYIQEGLLTKKSDVYSFGVVLLELITRKEATYGDKNSLVNNFLVAYAEGKSVTELVDKELGDVDDVELLDSFAGMIKECLNLDVSQRLDMTDLAERLHGMVERFNGK
ncbi:unnamed protein product [Alopecurus aequalis]